MKSSPRSLDILDLLAHLLELGFRGNHELGNAEAVRLGAHGIDFAIHLLQEKVELPAARFRTVSQRGPVCDVRAKSRDLLADVRTRGDADDFLRDGGLIRLEIATNFCHAIREAPFHLSAPLACRD